MHHHALREIAKVAVGLVIADLFGAFWFSSSGLFPLTILGVTWTASAIWPIVIFDAALILLLANYGWSMRLPIKSPAERKLLMLVGIVFLIVALLHLVRIAFGWNLILAEVTVPLWLSWVGVIFPGYLSYSSFHFALKK
jgi:hypothetical protein